MKMVIQPQRRCRHSFVMRKRRNRVAVKSRSRSIRAGLVDETPDVSNTRSGQSEWSSGQAGNRVRPYFAAFLLRAEGTAMDLLLRQK